MYKIPTKWESSSILKEILEDNDAMSLTEVQLSARSCYKRYIEEGSFDIADFFKEQIKSTIYKLESLGYAQYKIDELI